MIDPQVFPFVTRKAPQTWVLHLEQVSIYRKATIYKPSFLKRERNKKTELGLRFLFEFELLWFEDGA